jgi:hypothetical protein
MLESSIFLPKISIFQQKSSFSLENSTFSRQKTPIDAHLDTPYQPSSKFKSNRYII